MKSHAFVQPVAALAAREALKLSPGVFSTLKADFAKLTQNATPSEFTIIEGWAQKAPTKKTEADGK